jgi:hypothetical protein
METYRAVQQYATTSAVASYYISCAAASSSPFTAQFGAASSSLTTARDALVVLQNDGVDVVCRILLRRAFSLEIE